MKKCKTFGNIFGLNSLTFKIQKAVLHTIINLPQTLSWEISWPKKVYTLMLSFIWFDALVMAHSCHRSPMGKKRHLRNRCKQDGLDSSGGWSEIGIATVSICFTILCMLSTICSVNNYSLGLQRYQLDFETVSQYYALARPCMLSSTNAGARYCPSCFVCPALPRIVFNLLTWLIDSCQDMFWLLAFGVLAMKFIFFVLHKSHLK